MFEEGIFAAIIAFFKAVFGRKPSNPETEIADHALAAKQREAEILARPLPDGDALDDIVRRHQPK